MAGTLGRPASSEEINPIIEEIKQDQELWALILDRELEREHFQKLARELGKPRPDLEPEAFPPIKRPTADEAILEFLKRRYGRNDRPLASQIALRLGVQARHALGL